MSLFAAYISPSKLVVASDAKIADNSTRHSEFPKFQILTSNKGLPIIVGAVGHLSPIEWVFRVAPRILREVGFEIAQFQDFLPGFANALLAKRPKEAIDPVADVVKPPVTTIVAGFDPHAGRLRGWLSLCTGQGDGVIHELAPHDFAGIGFLEKSDLPHVEALNDFLKLEAPQNAAEWVARRIADEMRVIEKRHPENVGAPKYFAALDAQGALIQLPPDLPAPFSVREALLHAN